MFQGHPTPMVESLYSIVCTTNKFANVKIIIAEHKAHELSSVDAGGEGVHELFALDHTLAPGAPVAVGHSALLLEAHLPRHRTSAQ